MSISKQTGPKSLAGKRISSMNALKTGIFAKSKLLPFEDERAYQRHVKLIRDSLEPEDSVQVIYAEQIADSMWRGTRLELRASLHQDAVMSGLTPAQVAGMLGLSDERASHAPSYLLDPKYRISKKEVAAYVKASQEYKHLLTNVKGISNYQMVWRQYQHLFLLFADWLVERIDTPLLMNQGQDINLPWQQVPQKIEAYLAQFAHYLWFGIHYEELKPSIQVYMASWYFLQKRDQTRADVIEQAIMKERKVCQGLIDSYLRYRKSKLVHRLYRFENNGPIVKNEMEKNH